MSFPAAGTLNQVMRGVLFPSSNVLFDVQTQDPGARQKPGARAEAGTTTARYGDVLRTLAGGGRGRHRDCRSRARC